MIVTHCSRAPGSCPRWSKRLPRVLRSCPPQLHLEAETRGILPFVRLRSFQALTPRQFLGRRRRSRLLLLGVTFHRRRGHRPQTTRPPVLQKMDWKATQRRRRDRNLGLTSPSILYQQPAAPAANRLWHRAKQKPTSPQA